jgi:hypothetical protein
VTFGRIVGALIAVGLGLALYPLDLHRAFDSEFAAVAIGYDLALGIAIRLIVSGRRLSTRVGLSIPVGIAVLICVVSIYVTLRSMREGFSTLYGGPAGAYLAFGFYEGLPTLVGAFLLSLVPFGRLLPSGRGHA